MKTTKVFFSDRPSQDVVLYKTDLIIFNKPVFIERTKRSYNFYANNALIVRVYKADVKNFEVAKLGLMDRIKRSKINEAYFNNYIASCLANNKHVI